MKRSSVAFGGDFLWWTHWKWMSSSGGRCKLFKWWMAAAWLHLNPTDKWRRVRQACSIEANRFESQNFFFGNKKVPAVAIATGPPPQVFPPNFLSDGARFRLKKKKVTPFWRPLRRQASATKLCGSFESNGINGGINRKAEDFFLVAWMFERVSPVRYALEGEIKTSLERPLPIDRRVDENFISSKLSSSKSAHFEWHLRALKNSFASFQHLNDVDDLLLYWIRQF